MDAVNSIKGKANMGVQHALMERGAVGWIRLTDTDIKLQVATNVPESTQTYMPYFLERFVSRSVMESEKYLIHCTRARQGRWPDQSKTSYFDEMMNRSESSNDQASPYDTLRRILMQSRLLATHHLQKSDQATVSFSNVPLLELLSRRTFRSHLGRWDWEPYGIAVQRDFLEAMGARPVVYCSSNEIFNVAPENRVWMHPAGSRKKEERSSECAGNAKAFPDSLTAIEGHGHWSKEREWRLNADLHLASIPSDKAFIFVPGLEEALALATISRFPVMILRSCSDQKQR